MDTLRMQPDLLLLLKTLADEQRLTMVGLMSASERTVGEIATLLDLSEPTVSQHVSKMHGAGLLHLRMADAQRFYRLNAARMATFKGYVADMDTPHSPEPPPNDAWIEALDWDKADQRVLRYYIVNRRLREFPIKDRSWMVVLRWLATHFQPDVRYSEKQVNDIVTQVHEDYATLRRFLCEFGLMQRERGGGDYWLTPKADPIT